MRILGTGKVDDFQKVVLSKKVLKALGVKPGDGLIFSRGGKDGGYSSVQMFRAEGAYLSNEVDGRLPNDNGRPLLFLMAAIIVSSAVMLLLALGVFEPGWRFEADTRTLLVLASWMIMIVVLLSICIYTRMSMESAAPARLVSIKGPMAQDRVIGLTKMLSDGQTLSGTIFLYPLFGTGPEHINVYIRYTNGSTEPVPTKCVADGPGYSEYKVRATDMDLTGGGALEISAAYTYSDKAIIVDAVYGLKCDQNDRFHIDVSDPDISAMLHFDMEFQKAKFNEELFDPEDEDATI